MKKRLDIKMQGGFAIRAMIVITVIFSGTGCKVKKRLINEERKGNIAIPSSLPLLKAQSKKDFAVLKLKKVEGRIYINHSRENVKGNMAIYRDSLIVISIIPALGYEVLRIMCTPDSVIVINRHEKSYIATSFKRYREKYGIPFSFGDIQSIIANEVFFYMGQYYHNRMRINPDTLTTTYIIEAYQKEKKVADQALTVYNSDMTPDNIKIMDYREKRKIRLNYSAFENHGAKRFPREMSLIVSDKNVNVELFMNFGRVTFNEVLRVLFEIPENYKRENI